MTRPVMTPAIFGLLLTAMLAGGMPAGCVEDTGLRGVPTRTSGTAGAGGTTGTGGAAGTHALACPPTLPKPGSACSSPGIDCVYGQCPAGGYQEAVCVGGVWTGGACSNSTCPGGNCGGTAGASGTGGSTGAGPGWTCESSGIICSATGDTIQACCNATACEYVIGSTNYPCAGTDCSAEAQTVVNYCMGSGATGTGGAGGTGGSTGAGPGWTCASSGIACAKTGDIIQACCSSTACEYVVGTTNFTCAGTDCSAEAQTVVNYCMGSGATGTGGAGGTGGATRTGGAGGTGGSTRTGGATGTGGAGGTGGSTGAGPGWTCASSGVACAKTGDIIQACCSSTACEYVVGTTAYPCAGIDCSSEAQVVVNYCAGSGATGTGGASGTGGSTGAGPGWMCESSGVVCSKTGDTIQACCNSTSCEYVVGTTAYPCRGTDCSSEAQVVVNYCM